MALKAARSVSERKPAPCSPFSFISLTFMEAIDRFCVSDQTCCWAKSTLPSCPKSHYSRLLDSVQAIWCASFSAFIFEAHRRKAASRHISLGKVTKRKICQKCILRGLEQRKQTETEKWSFLICKYFPMTQDLTSCKGFGKCSKYTIGWPFNSWKIKWTTLIEIRKLELCDRLE